jgi:hypothetical protein
MTYINYSLNRIFQKKYFHSIIQSLLSKKINYF